MNYYRTLGQFTEPTGPVVYTGSGPRGPEIYSSMHFSGFLPHPDPSLAEKPIFGTLPPKVHSAEPNPTFGTKKFVEVVKELLPPFTTATSGNLVGHDKLGLLLTDDSHQSLLSQYPNHSIEELVALRLDPDSLVSGGAIDLKLGDDDFANKMVRSIPVLIQMLNKLSANGHAIFTVGSGNSDDMGEGLIRRFVLSGLRECLTSNKTPFFEVYNPMADLINRYAGLLKDRRKALIDLLPNASVQAIIIPYSRRFLNFSDYNAEWIRGNVVRGIHSVEANTMLGSGMDDNDIEKT